MTRAPRWAIVAIVCVAALITAVLVVVLVRDRHDHEKVAFASHRSVTIAAKGGARLDGVVYTPPGKGPFPLIVMPCSWGSSSDEYAAVATGFADLGYLVVSYAQRGFGNSTGTIDFAGPVTVGDVSTVIDWARAHTKANDKPVATIGTSYGAGVALLAAERDPRVVAVAAISGWADYAAGVAPGGTLNDVDYQYLLTTTVANRPLSKQLRSLAAEFRGRDSAAALKTLAAMSPARSPIEDVAALNKNKTAVFLSSTFQDSIAVPNDLVNLFGKLTGPKRLELAVGDHGANALEGLLAGKKSKLWTDVAKWVGHYLNGVDTGAQKQPAVQLQDASTGKWHSYPSWSAVGKDSTLYLTDPSSTSSGRLKTASGDGWSESIDGGVNTVADAGPQQMTTGQPYQAPSVQPARVKHSAGLVWSGPELGADQLVSGLPRVRIDVASDAAQSSLFAYLYDVDPSGTGRLMTFGTATVHGSPGAVNIELGPISWTVPAGDHLTLVIDSVDARYLGQSRVGSMIALSSTAGAPAALSLPVG